MKMLILTSLACAVLGAPVAARQQEPAPAQAPAPSEAERLFRDAWWAESGKNDLATALRGYLAAAAAEGPGSVRAKALLCAGDAQQRLGKTEAALDLFRKVLTEHATERTIVDEARVHLRELTAVDLRQNYDEWYERRLFGEEIQLLLLGKIEALTSLLARRPRNGQEIDAWHQEVHGLESEILAYGKGAVPALRKVSGGGSDEARQKAIDMLFTLGELPPIDALLSSQSWLGSPQHWTRLLAAGSAVRLPASTAWYRPLLAAAREGGSKLLQAMLALRDPNLFEQVEIVTPITTALLGDAASRDATVAAIRSTATPLLPRRMMERALLETEDGTLHLTAQQWVELSDEPLEFEVRVLGTRRAAGLIGKADEAILEVLLQRAETGPPLSQKSFTDALAEGLGRLTAPLDVPWTAQRLRRLMIAANRNYNGALVLVSSSLHLHGSTRDMMAEAILGEPAAFMAAMTAVPEADRVATPVTDQVAFSCADDRDVVRVATLWHAAMLSVLERDWQSWDDENRAAAVWVVQQAMRSEGPTDAMRAFLSARLAGAAAPVRAAIEALFAKLPG